MILTRIDPVQAGIERFTTRRMTSRAAHIDSLPGDPSVALASAGDENALSGWPDPA